MIKTKTKAAFVVKELERISLELGRVGESVYHDDPMFCEQVFKIISKIMFEIEGPVIADYPSLRPAAMLGEKYKNCTYRIICHDYNSNTDSINKTGILPEDAEKVLAKQENESADKPNQLFYLELETEK